MSIALEFVLDTPATAGDQPLPAGGHPLSHNIAYWVWGVAIPSRSKTLRSLGVRVVYGQASRGWVHDHLRDMQSHWPRYGMATGCMPNMQFMFLEVRGRDSNQQLYGWDDSHVNAVLDHLNLLKAGDPWSVVYSAS